MAARLSALLLLATLQACSQASSFQAAGPDWVDPRTGNLIAVKIRDVEEGIAQPLQVMLVESPWAALIIWNDDEMRFFLFDNPGRRFLATESWPEFLAAVRTLPEGTELQDFYKCSVPWDWRMPEGERKRLDRIMNARRIAWHRPTEEELSRQMVCIHGGMKRPGGVDFPGP